MAKIIAWGIALPSLRLPGKEISRAWGGSGARGLLRKTVAAFDEDPVTLGAASAQACLDRIDGADRGFDALFVGATTMPYEEKPSSASILSMLTANSAVRVVELRGSPQAGLQALAAANDFCAANPGARALAIGTDAPRAHPSSSFEHALGSGAAAFLVTSGAAEGASIDRIVAVSHETFGSRLRQRGRMWREDLELRVNDDVASLRKLAALGPAADARLASGFDPSLQKTARKLLNATGADEHWLKLGDLGAASGPVALADALEGTDGGPILAVAVGSGAVALHVTPARPGLLAPAKRLGDLADAGIEIDYLRYLKETGFLGRAGEAE
jgi:3-hydroxy-3-methylglutaryl CoA synthase